MTTVESTLLTGKERLQVYNLLTNAVSDHQAGRVADAEQGHRAVLQLQPDNPDALNLLGVVICSQGRSREGIALLERAVRANDAVAAYHSNLGMALRDAGRLGESVASLERALRIEPVIANDDQMRARLRSRILAGNGVLYENIEVVREFERFFAEAVRAHATARA